MLIENYNLPADYQHTVRVGRQADILVERSNAYGTTASPSLVVWQGALASQQINDGMQGPDWCTRLLKAVQDNPAWEWRARSNSQEKRIFDQAEIFQLAEFASGTRGSPSGNLVTTLNLRTYGEVEANIGGYAWWKEQNGQSSVKDPFVKSLMDKVEDMLGQAQSVGADFYVEQIALIITKDVASPNATLTPNLHSDESYGFRETALCSLFECGYNPFGGTIFMPTTNMAELAPYHPLTLQKSLAMLPEIPIVKSNAGDLLCYDGMKDENGVAKMENGIPHLSPDLPGISSRAIFLMRNKKVPILKL